LLYPAELQAQILKPIHKKDLAYYLLCYYLSRSNTEEVTYYLT